MKSEKAVYGIVAQFGSAEKLLEATRRVHKEGYRRMDAFTPFPVEGLHEALGNRRTILPWIVFAAGAFGCIGGLFMEYFAAVIDYPLNIGGRPLNSWPTYVPVMFEATILCGGLAALVGMLLLNRLPQLHHPVFNAPHFETASVNGFFLCIEARDSMFDREKTKQILEQFGGLNATLVEH